MFLRKISLLFILFFLFSFHSMKCQIADTVILGFGDISDFQVSPNGKYLASCSEFGIFIWDANNYKLLKKVWDDYTDKPEIVWSHDGYKIATNGLKGSIKVYDVRNQEFSNIIQDNRGKKYGVNWSPDDSKLACTNDDSTITVWNLENDELFYSVKDSQWIYDLKWSPDGAYISFIERDTIIKVIDAFTGDLKKIVNNNGTIFWYYRWSPDGKSIVTSNKGLIIWNITNNDKMILDSTNNNNDGIDFNPDGHKMVTSDGSNIYNKNNLIIWDIDKEKPIDTLFNNDNFIYEVKWSPDGSAIASSDYNGLIRIWNPDDGSLFATFQKQIDDRIHLAWNKEGTILFSYSTNYIVENTIRMWDIASKSNIHTIYDHAISTNQIFWSLDSKKIMNFHFGLQEWDAETGDLIKVTDLGDKQGLCFSPDRKEIASKTKDKIIILDAETLDEISSFYEYRNIYHAKWIPDGNKLGYVGDDSSLTIWDINKKIMLDYVRIGVQEIYDFAWHPDNRTIAICFTGFPMYIWDTIGDSIVTDLYSIFGGNHRIAYSPEYSIDGKYLAVCYEGVLFIIDANNYKQYWKFWSALYQYVLATNWSPDGSNFAGGFFDTVKVWERNNWNSLYSLTGHKDVIRDIEWSPDGTKLASSSSDGTNIVWKLKPTRVVEDNDNENKLLVKTYPNPATNFVTIEFKLMKPSFVKLAVYDAFGREIAVLVNEYQQPGKYSSIFKTSDLYNGVYFCHLEAGGIIETKKMQLIR